MRLFNTWKEVMFDPINFYKKLSKKEQYAEAAKYFLKVQAIVLALLIIVAIVSLYGFTTLIGLENNGVGDDVVSSIGLVILSLMLILIVYPLLFLFAWGMLYVGVGILHLFVLIFGGKKGYVETFKVVAYSISPNIFGMIPFVNYLAMAYALVLQVIGIKERQQLNWGKSTAVVLIPVGIGIILAIIIYFTLMATLLPLMAVGNAMVVGGALT